MKTTIPIPVDEEIYDMVKAAAAATGLSMADVMRQGLRHGVPAFTEKLRIASETRKTDILNYLDEYPRSLVTARESKKAIREIIKAKHARAHR